MTYHAGLLNGVDFELKSDKCEDSSKDTKIDACIKPTSVRKKKGSHLEIK